MSPAGSITAILAGHRDSPYLPRTLEAVGQGRTRPGRLILVLVDGKEPTDEVRELLADLELRGIEMAVLAHESATTGQAYAAGYEAAEDSARWLWLLHDDSAPTDDCLAELARVADASRAIAAAGPKQVGWEDPQELLEVGIRATRSSRRVPEIDPGERDQGQLDEREDVLGVGTAGMLVRREALTEIGGFDPALGPFGDGLEISRRLRAAGHRVVVVPRAKLRHARHSYADTAKSFGQRRGTQIYTALASAPTLVFPFLLLAYLLLAPLRALARLILKDIVRARGELWGAGFLLRRLGRLFSARRRLAKAKVTSAYRRLEATGGEVRAGRRDIRRARREARKLRDAPPTEVLRERAAHAARVRQAGTAATALAAILGIVFLAPHLSTFALTGGGLAPDATGPGELLEAARSSWVPLGDGYPGYLEPLWLAALPLSILAELVGARLDEAIFLFLLLSPALAALAAFRAAGLATASPALRFLAAIGWAGAPPFLAALANGELAAIVFHLVAPPLGAAMLRLWRTGRSSHLGVAAWWALLLVAAYPAAMIPLTFAAILAALFGRRPAWLWLVVPAGAFSAPALWELAKHIPRSLVAMPGVPHAWRAGERKDILAGWPTGIPGQLAPVIIAATALLIIAAVLGLARPRWRLAACGLALTGAGFVLIGAALRYPGPGPAAPWPGPGMTVAAGGILLAALAAGDRLATDLRTRPLGLRHLIAAAAFLAAIALPAASAWYWVSGSLTGRDDVLLADAPGEQVPALALKNAADPQRTRLLKITARADHTTVELWRGNGVSLTDMNSAITLAEQSAPADEELGRALTRAGESDFAELLAEHAVSVILLDGEGPGLDDLAARLDQTEGITKVTTSDLGTFWRLTVPTGRLMHGTDVIDSGLISASAEVPAGRLDLAERDDPGWKAYQGAEELPKLDDAWHASWQVPRTGEVRVVHEGIFSQWWMIGARLLIVLANLVVSLPMRRWRG
ncbi:MAG: glycosyltransferase [Flaviflexus sp.]|nr:glycosyltransferase [Flaviflexus sp.]